MFCINTFRLSQVAQHLTNIGVQQDGLLFQPSHRDGLAQIDAGIGGLGVLSRHAQERHFDDAGGVATHHPPAIISSSSPKKEAVSGDRNAWESDCFPSPLDLRLAQL